MTQEDMLKQLAHGAHLVDWLWDEVGESGRLPPDEGAPIFDKHERLGELFREATIAIQTFFAMCEGMAAGQAEETP